MQNEQSFFTISLKGLFMRFWKNASLTWGLVLLESMALVLIPLLIGRAVDGLLHKNTAGLFQLAGICGFLFFVGSCRRFYDTRAYARVYRIVANEVVTKENNNQSSVSTISARLQLFREFIQFLEMSTPDVIQQCVNLIGTLGIIILIDLKLALYCLVAAFLTALIYAVTDKRIYSLNKGRNSEFEKQVDILEKMESRSLKKHLKFLTLWEIRLSDLETINYSIIWIFLSIVLLFTVFTMTLSQNTSTGEVLSAVMYVFGFVESILVFPIYYQQIIRLREISDRLSFD